jgi:hypothetical protein
MQRHDEVAIVHGGHEVRGQGHGLQPAAHKEDIDERGIACACALLDAHLEVLLVEHGLRSLLLMEQY